MTTAMADQCLGTVRAVRAYVLRVRLRGRCVRACVVLVTLGRECPYRPAPVSAAGPVSHPLEGRRVERKLESLPSGAHGTGMAGDKHGP